MTRQSVEKFSCWMATRGSVSRLKIDTGWHEYTPWKVLARTAQLLTSNWKLIPWHAHWDSRVQVAQTPENLN
jgi:hypothetical protein